MGGLTETSTLSAPLIMNSLVARADRVLTGGHLGGPQGRRLKTQASLAILRWGLRPLKAGIRNYPSNGSGPGKAGAGLV